MLSMPVLSASVTCGSSAPDPAAPSAGLADALLLAVVYLVQSDFELVVGPVSGWKVMVPLGAKGMGKNEMKGRPPSSPQKHDWPRGPVGRLQQFSSQAVWHALSP